MSLKARFHLNIINVTQSCFLRLKWRVVMRQSLIQDLRILIKSYFFNQLGSNLFFKILIMGFINEVLDFAKKIKRLLLKNSIQSKYKILTFVYVKCKLLLKGSQQMSILKIWFRFASDLNPEVIVLVKTWIPKIWIRSQYLVEEGNGRWSSCQMQNFKTRLFNYHDKHR